MYNQCTLCANTTIIAFQDKNGALKIGNLTSQGWSFTQLGSSFDFKLGTGLALQPFARAGKIDQVDLFYQKSNLSMSLVHWVPAGISPGGAFPLTPSP